jgi:hypothetical protein
MRRLYHGKGHSDLLLVEEFGRKEKDRRNNMYL